jgi:hypothetical protein
MLSSSSQEMLVSTAMNEEKRRGNEKGNRGAYEDEPTLGQKEEIEAGSMVTSLLNEARLRLG